MSKRLEKYSSIVKGLTLISKDCIYHILPCLQIPNQLKSLIRSELPKMDEPQFREFLDSIALQLKLLSKQTPRDEPGYIYSLTSVATTVFLTFLNLFLTGINQYSLFDNVDGLYLREDGMLEITPTLGNAVKYRTFIKSLNVKAFLKVSNKDVFQQSIDRYNASLNTVSTSSYSLPSGWTNISDTFPNPCRNFTRFFSDDYITVLEEPETIPKNEINIITSSYVVLLSGREIPLNEVKILSNGDVVRFPKVLSYYPKTSLTPLYSQFFPNVDQLYSVSMNEKSLVQVVSGNNGIFITNDKWNTYIERFNSENNSYKEYNVCALSQKARNGELDTENSFVWAGKKLENNTTHLIYGKNYLAESLRKEYSSGIGSDNYLPISSFSPEERINDDEDEEVGEIYIGVGHYIYLFSDNMKEEYSFLYSSPQIGQITAICKVPEKNRLLIGSLLNNNIIISYIDTQKIKKPDALKILKTIASNGNDYIETITTVNNGTYNVASFKSGIYYVSVDNSATWNIQENNGVFKQVQISKNSKDSVLFATGDKLYKKLFSANVSTTSAVIPEIQTVESQDEYLVYEDLIIELDGSYDTDQLNQKIEQRQSTIILIEDEGTYIELRL